MTRTKIALTFVLALVLFALSTPAAAQTRDKPTAQSVHETETAPAVSGWTSNSKNVAMYTERLEPCLITLTQVSGNQTVWRYIGLPIFAETVMSAYVREFDTCDGVEVFTGSGQSTPTKLTFGSNIANLKGSLVVYDDTRDDSRDIALDLAFMRIAGVWNSKYYEDYNDNAFTSVYSSQGERKNALVSGILATGPWSLVGSYTTGVVGSSTDTYSATQKAGGWK